MKFLLILILFSGRFFRQFSEEQLVLKLLMVISVLVWCRLRRCWVVVEMFFIRLVLVIFSFRLCVGRWQICSRLLIICGRVLWWSCMVERLIVMCRLLKFWLCYLCNCWQVWLSIYLLMLKMLLFCFVSGMNRFGGMKLCNGCCQCSSVLMLIMWWLWQFICGWQMRCSLWCCRVLCRFFFSFWW